VTQPPQLQRAEADHQARHQYSGSQGKRRNEAKPVAWGRPQALHQRRCQVCRRIRITAEGLRVTVKAALGVGTFVHQLDCS
jgi:hypothetical protein